MCWKTCAVKWRGKACLVLLLVVALSSTPSQAEVNRDEYSDAHVSMIVPEGWVLAEQKSYPSLLVVAIRRGQPGRMNLVATEVKSRVTAKSYCTRSRRALGLLGFKTKRCVLHPGGAYILDGTDPKRKKQLRQAYLLHQGRLYVLTIAAPALFMASYERGFDDALRSMRFKKQIRPPSDAGPSPDANLP